jgi:NADH-quinone oxidoreductase subunit G
MPKLQIDGEEFEVAEGTSVLEAAQSRGVEIPHYCYHPALSIAGNCRMCLVEIEKAPKLAISCATPVAEGMVVHTHSEKVLEARKAVMEFLLLNHPLDCPICDQAGECKLQDHAVTHGPGASRYVEPKLSLKKAIDIGTHIVLDQERCIHCSRCVRFCEEVTGTAELSFFQRGERSQIGIVPGKRLDNAYSGNTVDLCPVGALTLKEFRFQNRVWYLKNTPSICGGCARGCNVIIACGSKQTMMTFDGQLDDRIKRLVPRANDAVNGHWMCDDGRLSYKRLAAGTPLSAAESPAGTAVPWNDAVAGAAGALKEAAGAGKAAAILSPRLTSETMFALRELFESIGGVRVAVRRLVEGEDDELLVRADKGANSLGAAWIFGEAATAAGAEKGVLDALASGDVQTLLVVGDPLDANDTARLDAGARAKAGKLIYLGAFACETAAQADLLLPTTAWAEEDGTWVNFEGRVQRVQRAHRPRGEGRPGWRVAADLTVAAGADRPAWTSAAEVLEALAAKVAPFAGMTEEKVGLLGAMGGAATPAGA